MNTVELFLMYLAIGFVGGYLARTAYERLLVWREKVRHLQWLKDNHDSQRTHILGGIVEHGTHRTGVCSPDCWCNGDYMEGGELE